MSTDDQDSKTEDASERKLAQARQKGDTWSSREAGHLMAFLGLLVLCLLVLPIYGPGFVLALSSVFSLAPQMPLETSEDLSQIMEDFALLVAGFLLPALGVLFVFALLSMVMSGPFLVSPARLKPKLSKFNPASGLKRMFSAQNLTEFTKNILRVTLLGAASFLAMKMVLDSLLPGVLLAPQGAIALLGDTAVKVLMTAALILIPFVAFDIFWKRFQWLKKQKMTKQDQKDEMKDTDGDPHIRAKRQELRRRALRRPHMQTVPEATLIITNPTHFAVALRYERGVDAAPVCLAKGTDLQALRIRDIALDHDVPVIESPPLARALYAGAEEEDLIPEEHWAAVAELVGYVLDLRRRIHRKLPEGSHHVTD
ncbi:EscU/YscU/HrcU family type III secretion system export apparatus switch protein [Falsigemmobacter faecalis]|uniref:Flagellar biosynthesis protein FlhB n=1 Tax=Falsigemmobacter faecalis TaxID=2488730 RepID=A0A3P3DPE2_9RHOB|nr:flagellar type III secretion system protein FlhB [Falsigemmobacter faecalis]RRH75804.1 flagellar biosynthesis protein FlhB [Falsigemmobacter faecalis]